MIIIMKKDFTKENIQEIVKRINQFGYSERIIEGNEKTIIAAVGHAPQTDKEQVMGTLLQYEGVDNVVSVSSPYKLVSQETHKEKTLIDLKDGVVIGGDEVILMGGPCSVESKEQLLRIAWEVKKSGAKILRGGAFKPRTSPYAFQGLEQEGLKFLKEVSQETGLKIITEVVSVETIEQVAEVADIMQIGARNMQNYPLLKALGQCGRPVMLKRGLSSTIQEWLLAAEYLMYHGNHDVILCERGIRTYEPMTRNTLDLNAVPVVKSLTHLPVCVDPSHGIGIADHIKPMALAGVACGADALIIEVHYDPPRSFSDPHQAIIPETFDDIAKSAKKVALAINRS